MKILTSFLDLQKALKIVNPYKIAVAYIGNDYDKFINAKQLKEIIVSPTIGSNPDAISSIVKTLDWDNVYFLNNLHSKIYLGKKAAMIGSPNLSRNAFNSKGLIELGILIDDQEIIDSLEKLFNEYKKLSKKAYPSLNSKKVELQNLFKFHNLLPKKYKPKLQIEKNINKTFNSYSIESDEQFKIVWYDIYERNEADYNKEVIEKEFSGESWSNIYSNISQDMEFAKNDSIAEGEWLLCFHLNTKNKAIKSGLVWMYIDKIINNAYRQKELPNAAIELTKSNKGQPPFKLDNKFSEVFVRVVNKPKYKIFREYDDGHTWLVKRTIPFMGALMSDIKKEYNK